MLVSLSKVYFTQHFICRRNWKRFEGALCCLTAHFHASDNKGSTHNSLPAVAKHLEGSKHVLVMTGAGLSTHSGIPDFRSPGTGLYDNLQQYNLPYPEAIFDLTFFMRDPRPFLSLAKELYPGKKYRPNLGHYLIRLLNEKGKLLRMYTQNIDGLERLAGLPADKLVEAHGSFTSASCIYCYKNHDPEETREAIYRGEVIHCKSGKCKGLVKPDIVFFGEALPERFFLYQDDVLTADLLIVIGTSLEVYPFAMIAEEVPRDVPRLLLNREVVGSFGHRKHDTILECDIIEGVLSLVKEIGWHKELMELYNKYEIQQ